MGLYDRDYMRKPSDGDSDAPAGSSRLQFRRWWLIVIGMVLLLAAGVAMLN